MGTPVPSRNEPLSRPSEVKTYRLSPEELANLEAPKAIPRNQSKPVVTKPTSQHRTNAGASTRKRHSEIKEAEMLMSNVEWFTPERKVEGPAVIFYKEGAGINKAGQQLMGVKVGETLHFGYDETKRELMIKVAPGGIKTTTSKSQNMRLNSRSLTDWVKAKKIKIQKYSLSVTDQPGMFTAAIELE